MELGEAWCWSTEEGCSGELLTAVGRTVVARALTKKDDALSPPLCRGMGGRSLFLTASVRGGSVRLSVLARSFPFPLSSLASPRVDVVRVSCRSLSVERRRSLAESRPTRDSSQLEATEASRECGGTDKKEERRQ